MTLGTAGTKNLNSIGILCLSFLVYSLVNSVLIYSPFVLVNREKYGCQEFLPLKVSFTRESD